MGDHGGSQASFSKDIAARWCMTEYGVMVLVHGAIAVLSGSSFIVRGVWRLMNSPLLSLRWVRIAPHVIDTLLLLLGVVLAVWSHQYPFTHAWLTAKLLALLAYIGLGLVALRFATSLPARLFGFIGALSCFGYMLAVAFTRSAVPWG